MCIGGEQSTKKLRKTRKKNGYFEKKKEKIYNGTYQKQTKTE